MRTEKCTGHHGAEYPGNLRVLLLLKPRLYLSVYGRKAGSSQVGSTRRIFQIGL
jgi:hypothetical protein